MTILDCDITLVDNGFQLTDMGESRWIFHFQGIGVAVEVVVDVEGLEDFTAEIGGAMDGVPSAPRNESTAPPPPYDQPHEGITYRLDEGFYAVQVIWRDTTWEIILDADDTGQAHIWMNEPQLQDAYRAVNEVLASLPDDDE